MPIVQETSARLGNDGLLSSQGVVEWKNGKILAEEDGFIAVKFPSGTTWISQFSPREYYPSETVVFQILEKDGTYYRLKTLLEWSNTRKKSE